jgi:rhodanese-related sulfurtransferase
VKPRELMGALSERLSAWLTPTVPTLSLPALRAALARAEDEAGPDNTPLLVDVRSPRETAVSMIPGAITRADYEHNPQHFSGRQVVAYCTVGFRSARYTRRLIRRGVDSANFRGSILAWTRAGLPLHTPAGEPTRRLHTWSRRIQAPPGYQQVVD